MTGRRITVRDAAKAAERRARERKEAPAPAAPVPAPPAAPAQLRLLGVLPAEEAAEVARGPGRPQGAQSRSTSAWRDYLVRRYGHPVEGLLRLASMDPLELAKALACKPLEAMGLIAQAAREAAPYIAPKQAAVQVTDASANAVPITIIQQFGQAAGGGEGKPVAAQVLEAPPGVPTLAFGQSVKKQGDST